MDAPQAQWQVEKIFKDGKSKKKGQIFEKWKGHYIIKRAKSIEKVY